MEMVIGKNMSAADKKPHIPGVSWAQRTDFLYVNIHVDDVENTSKIKLTDDKLHFSGKNSEAEFEIEMEFFKQIDVEKSRYTVRPRQVEFRLYKKETGQPFWERLLKQKEKAHFLRVDFNLWRDEDDSEEEEPSYDLDQMMKKIGDDKEAMNVTDDDEEEEDSDDDAMPELEEKVPDA